MRKPVVLCILDGCGLREESDGNAFKNAKKPTLDMLFNKYPHSILQASGPSVGLPEGQMGTSEVGHMNLGSGRIALQPLEAITNAIENKELNKNEELLKVLNHVKENNSNLHLMGLLSDGGVHSHIDHLLALLDICKENEVNNVYIQSHTYDETEKTIDFTVFKDGKEITGIDVLGNRIESNAGTYNISLVVNDSNYYGII